MYGREVAWLGSGQARVWSPCIRAILRGSPKDKFVPRATVEGSGPGENTEKTEER